jgi:hypothetical protein
MYKLNFAFLWKLIPGLILGGSLLILAISLFQPNVEPTRLLTEAQQADLVGTGCREATLVLGLGCLVLSAVACAAGIVAYYIAGC